jgi:dephospho-CoA kinase
MKNKKLKVAITGSIGSGKSAFCSMLEEKGFTVLKADDISKDILSNDKSVQQKIIKIFGENSFINGKPDKLFLAEKVFSDPKNVVKINSILHPKVIEIISKKTDEILDKK